MSDLDSVYHNQNFILKKEKRFWRVKSNKWVVLKPNNMKRKKNIYNVYISPWKLQTLVVSSIAISKLKKREKYNNRNILRKVKRKWKEGKGKVGICWLEKRSRKNHSLVSSTQHSTTDSCVGVVVGDDSSVLPNTFYTQSLPLLLTFSLNHSQH